MSKEHPKTTEPTRTANRAAFRRGFREGQLAAIDRCEIELNAVGCSADVIKRCIASIAALDSRHFPVRNKRHD